VKKRDNLESRCGVGKTVCGVRILETRRALRPPVPYGYWEFYGLRPDCGHPGPIEGKWFDASQINRKNNLPICIYCRNPHLKYPIGTITDKHGHKIIKHITRKKDGARIIVRQCINKHFLNVEGGRSPDTKCDQCSSLIFQFPIGKRIGIFKVTKFREVPSSPGSGILQVGLKCPKGHIIFAARKHIPNRCSVCFDPFFKYPIGFVFPDGRKIVDHRVPTEKKSLHKELLIYRPDCGHKTWNRYNRITSNCETCSDVESQYPVGFVFQDGRKVLKHRRKKNNCGRLTNLEGLLLCPKNSTHKTWVFLQADGPVTDGCGKCFRFSSKDGFSDYRSGGDASIARAFFEMGLKRNRDYFYETRYSSTGRKWLCDFELNLGQPYRWLIEYAPGMRYRAMSQRRDYARNLKLKVRFASKHKFRLDVLKYVRGIKWYFKEVERIADFYARLKKRLDKLSKKR
jgi:hypothetical protein